MDLWGLLQPMVRLLLGFVLVYAMLVCCWLWIHFDCWVYGIYSKDKKWTPLADVATAGLPDPSQIRTRRIVFVRHGESTWNETFNKSKNPVYFIPRLVRAALFEIKLLLAGVQDSWFMDAPLSEVGFREAKELRDFIAKGTSTQSTAHREFSATMLGTDGQRSTVVCSNLRRAISTCVAALWDRLQRDGEEILLLSDLQEISPNPDTIAITPAFERPVPSWIDTEYRDVPMATALATKINPAEHRGNKDLSSNGMPLTSIDHEEGKNVERKQLLLARARDRER